MNENQDTTYHSPRQMDVLRMCIKLWKHKRVFFVVMPIVLVLSSIYEYSLPSVYKSEVMIIPEYVATSLSEQSNMTRLFPFKLLDDPQTDAISPCNYQQIIASRDFMCELFGVVVTNHRDIPPMTYFEYMTRCQKYPWWTHVIGEVKGWFKGGKQTGDTATDEVLQKEKDWESHPDVFRLTAKQDAFCRLLASQITCDFDLHKATFAYAVKDQDPEIAAQMADSIRQHLDSYINRYRRSRIAADLVTYEAQMEMARKNYIEAKNQFAMFVDQNQDIAQRAVLIARKESLEKEMDHALEIVQAMDLNIQAAKAKNQAYSPAFATIVSPSVPLKPFAPRRIAYIMVALFVAFICSAGWVLRDELF